MNMLEEGIRYLELRLAEGQARPELHEHQNDAYTFFLQLARSSADGDDYIRRIRETGDMYQLARAESMDRYQNLLRIHRTLQDDRKMHGAALVLNAAREAQSHGDFHQRVTAATTEAQAWTQAAGFSGSQISGLFTALLDWKLECKPLAKAGRLATLEGTWRMLCEHDPDCSWHKLTTFPPYRQRIPFDDARLAQLGVFFQEAIG